MQRPGGVWQGKPHKQMDVQTPKTKQNPLVTQRRDRSAPLWRGVQSPHSQEGSTSKAKGGVCSSREGGDDCHAVSHDDRSPELRERMQGQDCRAMQSVPGVMEGPV